MENRKFVDMSLMGVGTNILGYSNNHIDNAVKNVIKKGTMSSLNCYEEVFLAEKLISIHSWSKWLSLLEQVEKLMQYQSE